MRNQFNTQRLMSWDLDSRILSKATTPEHMLVYADLAFTKIVLPLDRHIRTLMFMFRQHTEAALFASDLKFHISASTTEDVQSSVRLLKPDAISGAKPDEALTILNFKLSRMVQDFKRKVKVLLEDLQVDDTYSYDFNIATNLAVAIYFASYFHLKNQACRRFIGQHSQNGHLMDFLRSWENAYNERVDKVKNPDTKSKLLKGDFQTFLDEMRLIEEQAMTNPKRF